MKGKNFPPILIYPEGTTGNNKCIMNFKRGAFEPMMPIKAYCLDYKERHYFPGIDSIPMHYQLLL